MILLPWCQLIISLNLYFTSGPFHYFFSPMFMAILCLLGYLVHWVALTGYLSCCQLHIIMATFPILPFVFPAVTDFFLCQWICFSNGKKVATVRMLIRVTSNKNMLMMLKPSIFLARKCQLTVHVLKLLCVVQWEATRDPSFNLWLNLIFKIEIWTKIITLIPCRARKRGVYV